MHRLRQDRGPADLRRYLPGPQVEFVYAHDHREAMARAQTQASAMESLARQIASTTPRQGEWERSYRALQERARHALAHASGVISR